VNDLDFPSPAQASPAAAAPGMPAPRGASHRITARELLGSRGELVIMHAGREYRLRITQNNKLILTA
jgi:hemin uptake protein HemP